MLKLFSNKYLVHMLSPQAMHLTPDSIALRSSDFYSTHSIEVMLGKEATGVDVEGKKVNFADGEAISYDSLLLATGAK